VVETPVKADYVFPVPTVYLSDILQALGLRLTQNNYNVAVDNASLKLSGSRVNRNGFARFTLTAQDSFTLATLTLVSTNGKDRHSLTLSYTAPEEEEDPPVELKDFLPGDAIWANDALYLTGKMPGNAVVEAIPVAVVIDGEDVLAAYDINIYPNANQQKKGHTWQPAGDKVQVHLIDAAFGNNMLDVYHLADAAAEPEHVATVIAQDGEISFEAESFSIYAIVETKLTETIDASDGNTYEIEVTYKNTSGIPMQGTALMVSELKPGEASYEEYVAAGAAKVGAEAESIELSRVFDIRIVDENDHSTVYEPVGDVTVSIRLVGEALNDYANLDVLHFVEDENTEGFTVYDVNSIIDGETVQFTTDSFSVYVVIGSTYLRTYRFYTFNEFGEYVEYALYTDSGKTTFTQTIKNGEKPIAPQNPTNPQDPNATFAGWYEDIREAGAADPVFSAEAYNFDNIPEITETEEVHLYAKFKGYAYLVLHDQYDPETGTFPVAYTIREETTGGSVDITISNYRVSYHGNGNTMVFTGWSEEPITTPGASNNDLDEAVSRLSDTITVTGNKELYPIFTPVYWITFYSGYSGSGATYYPEAYYFDGAGPASLADHIPTRDAGSSGAYTFAGWYAGATLEGEEGKEEATIASAVRISDAAGTLVDDFDDTDDLGISVHNGTIVLTKDVTLYAAWTATGTADYSVIIWKQKASDSAGLSDDEKTYDFVERIIRSSTINSTVSTDSDDTGRDY
ncbi:MAG: InlB B-repeat-containing protein, partial [Mogibacterium sp.]|nr:InlB B-repeat-containing protein [Mogibacterium sp.]